MNRTTYIIYILTGISIEIIDNSIEIIDKLYRYVISDTLKTMDLWETLVQIMDLGVTWYRRKRILGFQYTSKEM